MKKDSLGRKVNPSSTAHCLKHGGFVNHRSTYQCWQDMKQRCLNPKHKLYKHYGGRGIVICARWLNDFASFFADLGPKPDGMTLDRENNDGPYAPSNCRWATRAEQRRNQRNVKWIVIDGERLTHEDAGRKFGMRGSTFSTRLEFGWTLEEIAATPIGARRCMPAARAGKEQK